MVVFWWVLLWLVQVVERAFLVSQAARLEAAGPALVARTLVTGTRADLIVASLAVVLALLVAAVVTAPAALVSPRSARTPRLFRSSLAVTCGTLVAAVLLVLTVDMAYYGENRQHLDAIFFDYIEELFSVETVSVHAGTASWGSRQALTQTRAELGDVGKWAGRIGGFALLQVLVVVAWRLAFRRAVDPALSQWISRRPLAAASGLGLGIVAGLTGLHPYGPFAIARTGISSATYYTLAQSPIWQTIDASLLALVLHPLDAQARVERLMPLDEAIRVTQQSIAPEGAFPFSGYPLVWRAAPAAVPPAATPMNVLLVFVEGLDRRYVGPDGDRATSGGRRVAPFLERWAGETVVFRHFFSNGRLTHHGLFASLCSYAAGYGKSPIKVRYTQDYLCVPDVLRRAGYWTEMVIGYNRDHHQDHTALFLARNGLHRFLDEGNFPADAERLGLGVTDGALFDQVRARIEALQAAGQPFFLATLTLSTHHPFVVPPTHPDVRALSREPDKYLAALRYADAELERFFTGLARAGLLRNMLVLVLGDHGRHEVVGSTEDERWLGHHLTPLFVWMDPASPAAAGFRPRRVDTVASQVDVGPTILGLLGLSPRVAPFLGKDLRCVIVSDCHPEHRAMLFTGHSAAVVERGQILRYWLESGLVRETDLAGRNGRDVDPGAEPEVARRLARLQAMLVASTRVLAQNRVWSWQHLGPALADIRTPR